MNMQRDTAAEPTGLKAGQRVRIHQSIDRREGPWTNAVEGVVVSVKAEKTGSWYAHGKEDKLWLYRVRLQRTDGELTTVVVDPHTRYEILSD